MPEKQIEIAIAVDIARRERLGIAEPGLGGPGRARRIWKRADRLGLSCAFENVEAIKLRTKEIGSAIAGEVAEESGEEKAGVVVEESSRSPACGRAAKNAVGRRQDDFQLRIAVQVPNHEWIDEE